ncbi:serine/threonine protein phosphatase PrpC [Actinoalloteichus hymeniacidonis]|nr:serine/threonine protein phosphatase PrpC [Actinoalloteichus hymeniacidonis]
MDYVATARLVYAGDSHPGQARTANEDSAFASPRLLAVADGMGGHVHGEVACTEAVRALAELDTRLASSYGAPQEWERRGSTRLDPGRPDAVRPDAERVDVERPEVARPEAAWPPLARPELVPDPARPLLARSGSVRPELAHPEAGRLDSVPAEPARSGMNHAHPVRPDPVESLGACIADVFTRLCEIGLRRPELTGMGTTLTALVFDGDRLGVGHIGDSRAYLLSAGVLRQITRDHTFVQSLVDQGHLTPAQAAEHPRRSMVVRALQSGGPVPEADLFFHRIAPGDRLLVCSDGLTDVLADETLSVVLATQAEPADAVHRLIDLANRAGGPDNITCLVADVLPGDRRDAEEAPHPAIPIDNDRTGGRLILGAAADRLSAAVGNLPTDEGGNLAGDGRTGVTGPEEAGATATNGRVPTDTAPKAHGAALDGTDHARNERTERVERERSGHEPAAHGPLGPARTGDERARPAGADPEDLGHEHVRESTVPSETENRRGTRRWRLPRWARKP